MKLFVVMSLVFCIEKTFAWSPVTVEGGEAAINYITDYATQSGIAPSQINATGDDLIKQLQTPRGKPLSESESARLQQLVAKLKKGGLSNDERRELYDLTQRLPAVEFKN